MAFFADPVLDVAQQFGMAAGADFGIAELFRIVRFDLAAQLMRHRLQAVADAEYRHLQVPDRVTNARRFQLGD